MCLLHGCLQGGLAAVLLLFFLHIVGIVISVIINVVQQNSLRQLLYWLFNLLGPNINAQVIISDILVAKSQLCKGLAKPNGAFLFPTFSAIRSNKATIIWNWVILVAHIVIYLTLLIVVDIGLVNCTYSCRREPTFDENTLDDDVLAERHRILQLHPVQSKHSDTGAKNNDDGQETDHLIVEDLTKQYSGRPQPAVNHLTFGAKRGEAFGLLGFNASHLSLSLSLTHFLIDSD